MDDMVDLPRSQYLLHTDTLFREAKLPGIQ